MREKAQTKIVEFFGKNRATIFRYALHEVFLSKKLVEF